MYKHLKKPKSHVKPIFVYFTLAFNQMQPHILIEQLASYFKLPDQILMLLLDFLMDGIQQVFMNEHYVEHNMNSMSSTEVSVEHWVPLLSAKDMTLRLP